MARPTKYTPERSAKIIDGLKAGMTRGACCGLVSIDENSLARWIARYASFGQQVLAAEHAAEACYTDVIAKAAFGHEVVERREVHKANGDTEVTIITKREYDWKAAQFWLSRRRRDDWGDRLEVVLYQEMAGLLDFIAAQHPGHFAEIGALLLAYVDAHRARMRMQDQHVKTLNEQYLTARDQLQIPDQHHGLSPDTLKRIREEYGIVDGEIDVDRGDENDPL